MQHTLEFFANKMTDIKIHKHTYTAVCLYAYKQIESETERQTEETNYSTVENNRQPKNLRLAGIQNLDEHVMISNVRDLNSTLLLTNLIIMVMLFIIKTIMLTIHMK